MSEIYEVGQSWSFDGPKGFEDARLIIGAIVTFEHHEPVICAFVTDAPMLDDQGKVKRMAIPFLPFSKSAFDATVIENQGNQAVPGFFQQSYERWKSDDKGMGFIDMPFNGLLNNMVDDLMSSRQKSA